MMLLFQGTTLLEHQGAGFVVGVHTEMAQEWLENRLHDVVQRAVSSVVGYPVTIEFRLANNSE